MRLIDADALLEALDRLDLDYGAMGGVAECMDRIDDAPTIVPSGNTKSCGVSADRHTDQNVADVPIVEKQKELCEIAESIHQLDEVDPTSWSKAIQSEKEELALQKAISIIDKIPSVDPSDYMCFSCKYGNRVGMPCKECKHDYEDKYTPINKYGTIPRLDIDLISKESAICAIENTDCQLTAWDWDELTDAINKVPSADVVSREEYNKLLANSIWESEHIGKMLEYQNETEPSGDLISREEAIEAVANAIWHLPNEIHSNFNSFDFAEDIAKDALKALPSADRPNYNLETIADIVKQLGHLDGCIADMCGRPQVNSNSAEEQIAETCDRPKGEWKWTHGGQCSECGFHNSNFDFNFCPSCGADMRGADR